LKKIRFLSQSRQSARLFLQSSELGPATTRWLERGWGGPNSDEGTDHRLYRVLSFISSRPNWYPLTPSPAGECIPPPLVPGGTHSLAGGGGGGNSDEVTVTVVIYMYFVVSSIECGLSVGGKGTGKTAIISQFLYDQYNTAYKETVEEMYRYVLFLALNSILEV
jgi:hypothetical protein